MTKPLAIDLFAGLGGWTEGLLLEGYDVIGFDIECHRYGDARYPAQLVVQDVLTLHGSQFRSADLIVASPPCQEYSYMAMPWSKAKAKAKAIRADTTGKMFADLTRLFDACFRIQKEASIAAGRHVPMVVENVRGAIPWVGRSRWNFGSFHLWGDVPALMPPIFRRSTRLKTHQGERWNVNRKNYTGTMQWDTGYKTSGMNWSDRSKTGQDFTRIAGKQAMEGMKNDGGSWFKIAPGGKPGERNNARDRLVTEGIKCGGDWFNSDQPSISRLTSSKSNARKAASAMIAKIPLPLSRHIAATYRP